MGAGGQEESTQSDHHRYCSQPLSSPEAVAEPQGQDQEEEQQLRREHGLYRAQLSMFQCNRYEAELHEAEPESDEPDLLPDRMAHEARLESGRFRSSFDSHTLQHRGQGVCEGRQGSKEDCYHGLRFLNRRRHGIAILSIPTTFPAGKRLSRRFPVSRGSNAVRVRHSLHESGYATGRVSLGYATTRRIGCRWPGRVPPRCLRCYG